MGLRDIETTLPPGFRFYPSDEELVCHYLHNKVTNQRSSGGTMVEVDLHTREPWELPEVAKLSANEWYFFSFRDRKYATGSRANRATKSGYWKATGKDRTVYDPSSHAIVGMRKTLVFYRGRAPNGIKSGWVMHEFRLENPHTPPKEDWVLCRVFHKRKGEEENMRSHSPTADSSPPLMADHATAAEGSSYGEMVTSFPNFVPQCQEVYSPNPFFNVALMQCNLLDLPQEVESSSSMMGMGSRNGQDHCGLFLDVGFDEDHGMEEEVGFGNFGGMRFQSG